MEHHIRPLSLAPTNGYSHAVRHGGLIAVSGQLPTDPTGALVSPDVGRQTARVLENLEVALQATGADRTDLFQMTYYLLDLDDLPQVRAVREMFFGDAPRPATSLVQVSGLVLPGARLEIDALAVVDGPVGG